MLEDASAPAYETAELGYVGEVASDPELSGRLQSLEPAAWRELYVCHQPLIRSIIAVHLGYGPETDDVTQGVFETALDLVSRGRVRLSGSDSAMRAWLIAIAIRLAKAEQRRRRRLRTLDESNGSECIGTPPLDAVGRQLLERTTLALQSMPDRLRIPWILRHFEHMSLEETARCLNVSLATVKRRLSAADRRFMILAHRDAVLRERLKG
jgi:RNA polymerase sigma-70 factor, ECF subfamily